MRRRAILAVAAALVLAGCSPDREVTRPAPEPVTADNVAAAVLTIDDLPDRFTAVEEATPISAEVVPEHSCDDRLGDLDPEESSSADFSDSTVTLTHTVAWFPGAGGAVEQLFRDVAAACAQVVAPDGSVSIRAGGLNFGVLSDDTLAIRFEVEPKEGAITERDLVLRREGDLISLIRMSGPRPSDKVLLDSAVRVAISRLGSLAQATG